MTERLRATRAPGEEEARRRAWALAQAALAERSPVRARRRIARIAVPATAAVLAAVILTPPGGAVADWMRERARDVVGSRPAPVPRPARSWALPGGGKLLLTGPAGPLIDGLGRTRRVAGPVAESTWSPHGLYVAVIRGRRLEAVDLRGAVHWRLASRQPIAEARWAPSGYRIAYLAGRPVAGGRELRVVAGDGTGDHPVAAAGPAAPAWKPVPDHLVASLDAANRVALRDADSGRLVWRAHTPRPARRLVWSADGRVLVALAGDRAWALDGATGTVRRAPAFDGAQELAAAPRGTAFALGRRAGAESRVVLVDGGSRRLLLATAGPVRALAWSPDGRWLAVDAPRAGGLLLLRVRGGRLDAVRSLPRPRGSVLEGWEP